MVNRKVTFLHQNRLILLFLLTIVLPSVTLSIFGIQAIRNERYRKEQQNITDLQKTVGFLKRRLAIQVKDGEEELKSRILLSSVNNRDYERIREIIFSRIDLNPLINQVIVLFDDGQVFFPLLEASPEIRDQDEVALSPEMQSMLNRAKEEEYVRHNYGEAALLFKTLAESVNNSNSRARMLNHAARNQKKAGRLSEAVSIYKIVNREYPQNLTGARLPLALSAEMQIVNINKILLDSTIALEGALSLYRKILYGNWHLNENQFRMYCGMAEDIVQELLNTGLPDSQKVKQQFRSLQQLRQVRNAQWRDRGLIESPILPELSGMFSTTDLSTIRINKVVQGEEFSISAIPVPGQSEEQEASLLCIVWDRGQLLQSVLRQSAEVLLRNERISVFLSDQKGQPLLGESAPEGFSNPVTGEFEGNFPPWKMQLSRKTIDAGIGAGVYRSYYFWTILTLLIILSFGAVLIIRTMAHEREVMAIKSNFVSSVSHELKTPLTSIKALTERLLDGKVKDPDKMFQYYSVIAQDADKLTRLVKNILDFSKIEAGKKEYHFQPVDMAVWLEETLQIFRNERSHDEVEINLRIDRDVPSLDIDRDELTQCLNNLLDNAIKFSPDSKTVEVTLEQKNQSIMIHVKDQGSGIAREDLDHVFDKFYQGAQPIRQSVKGTGLGLTLVRHAVEAHGGRIEVQSRSGEGSTFKLIFPNHIR